MKHDEDVTIIEFLKSFKTVILFIKKNWNTITNILTLFGISVSGIFSYLSYSTRNKNIGMYHLQKEYTEELVPLLYKSIRKCGTSCFGGVAYLEYNAYNYKYSGLNMTLYGIDNAGVMKEALTSQLYKHDRDIAYGTCTSKEMDKIMNSSNGCDLIYIRNLYEKCPEDKAELDSMFFTPRRDKNKNIIACGNWASIINKAVVCVFKPFKGEKAYAISWLSMTNPINNNKSCYVPSEDFEFTGCELDDCNLEMKELYKKGQKYIIKNRLMHTEF